jgi:hypothetical protein
VSCLAFSPDGKTIASGDFEGAVKLWELKTGQERGIFRANAGSVFSVAFTPDGKRVVAASADKTLKLWETSSLSSALRPSGVTANMQARFREEYPTWKTVNEQFLRPGLGPEAVFRFAQESARAQQHAEDDKSFRASDRLAVWRKEQRERLERLETERRKLKAGKATELEIGNRLKELELEFKERERKKYLASGSPYDLADQLNGSFRRGVLYQSALAYCDFVALARSDDMLTPAQRDLKAERLAAFAVQLLNKAQEEGFFKAPAMLELIKKDPRLDPVRTREDFQKLLRSLDPEIEPNKN